MAKKTGGKGGRARGGGGSKRAGGGGGSKKGMDRNGSPGSSGGSKGRSGRSGKRGQVRQRGDIINRFMDFFRNNAASPQRRDELREFNRNRGRGSSRFIPEDLFINNNMQNPFMPRPNPWDIIDSGWGPFPSRPKYSQYPPMFDQDFRPIPDHIRFPDYAYTPGRPDGPVKGILPWNPFPFFPPGRKPGVRPLPFNDRWGGGRPSPRPGFGPPFDEWIIDRGGGWRPPPIGRRPFPNIRPLPPWQIQPRKPKQEYAPGYGGWIDLPPDAVTTMDWRDKDNDGIDDRRQSGPGQPRPKAGWPRGTFPGFKKPTPWFNPNERYYAFGQQPRPDNTRRNMELFINALRSGNRNPGFM